MSLAEKLGTRGGQLAHDNLTTISVEVEGVAAELNLKTTTAAVLTGLMRRYSDSVNMVNAPHLARERGLDIREASPDREGDYHTLVRVTVEPGAGARTEERTVGHAWVRPR